MNRRLIGAVICTLLLVSCAEDKGENQSIKIYIIDNK